MSIPKIIHQTLPSREEIDPAFQENIANLKRLNPTWEHRLYDDEDITLFISRHFGPDSLDCFNLIDPRYGAARADFFRYLLMYVEGGVYLDIKSTATRPLDEVLQEDDEYILSHWRNKPDQEFAGWGRWPGLGPEGEYQQWHIICASRHKFLESVIEQIKKNIESCYAGERVTGHAAVLTLTGPVAYTRAIQPILAEHRHRKVDIEDLGFRYTVLSEHGHHDKQSGPHYSRLGFPILRFEAPMVTDKLISTLSKRFDHGVGDLLHAAFMARSNGGSATIVTFHGTSLFYLFQLDRCVHEESAGNCLHVPVRFELFGANLSFFIEVGGIRIRLGVDAAGQLASQFDAAEQGTPLFQLRGQGEGLFTISWKEHFLCAESGGKLVCDRTTANRWESFSVTHDTLPGMCRDSVENSFTANEFRTRQAG